MKKTKEETQDLLKIYVDAGIPIEQLLSLGYVGIGTESTLAELPVQGRNSMLRIKSFLVDVLSEALKPNEFRNDEKMLGALRMAVLMTDIFYCENPELFILHSPLPTK